ncbi:MAG: hypothetical protein ACM3NO_09190 [Deltaproteobacteria bacterium]
MAWFDLSNPRNRIILTQIVIVVLLLGFYKLALPRIQKAREASATEEREQRMMDFVQSVVVDVGSGDESKTPQRLRVTPQVHDVELELGAPQESMNDALGGQHLTWIGTRHKLMGSFDKGKLYAVSVTDMKTGHGRQIFESSAQFRPF